MEIQITEWRDAYSEDFKRLSLEWLQKYVEVEPRDIEMIEHPYEVILNKGGMTWFALADDKVVGTISVLQEESGEWELAKMAVTEEYKGYGISNRLIMEALAFSRKKGIEKLVLYTNSVLAPAVHQYHKYGFVDVPIMEETYDTADLKMELKLNDARPCDSTKFFFFG